MNIEWSKNAHCWTGTTAMGYPHFKAWSSNGSVDGQWCVRIILSPGDRAIKVSGLHSLDEVEHFAEGMLMGLNYRSDSRLPVENLDHAKEEAPCLYSRLY